MADCGACFYADYDNGGPDDFLNRREVVARKEHECCECRGVIPIGATYEKVTGKWDGYFDTYKTCAVCVEIRNAFGCHGYIYTQLWDEHMPEIVDEITTGCFERLETAAAKQKVMDFVAEQRMRQ